MFKVIFKTAIKTLFVVAILALVAFGIASLGFPSEMAGLCEKSGNYSMATGYASLSYTYTKDVNDLNRCFVDSLYANNDNDAVKFGDQLIADEKFEEVCKANDRTLVSENGLQINIDYKQYVCGNVASAKYRLGRISEALETATAAMNGVEGFPANNALVVLSLQVIESEDKDMANTLLAEVSKHTPAEGEEKYYSVLITELTKVGGQE